MDKFETDLEDFDRRPRLILERKPPNFDGWANDVKLGYVNSVAFLMTEGGHLLTDDGKFYLTGGCIHSLYVKDGDLFASLGASEYKLCPFERIKRMKNITEEDLALMQA